MSTAIHQIVNANVYMNGNSLLGKAKEFKLPDIEFEFIAMEGEVIWDSFYPEVRVNAYNPYKNVQLMARSNVQVFDSRGLAAEESLVTTMNVAFNKTTGGSLKNKEATEHSDSCQIMSIKQTLAGKEILFVDVLANIYRVNGQDVLQKYRTNIGQ